MEINYLKISQTKTIIYIETNFKLQGDTSFAKISFKKIKIIPS